MTHFPAKLNKRADEAEPRVHSPADHCWPLCLSRGQTFFIVGLFPGLGSLLQVSFVVTFNDMSAILAILLSKSPPPPLRAIIRINPLGFYGNLEIKSKLSWQWWSLWWVPLVTHTAIIGLVLEVGIDPAGRGGCSPSEPSCSPHTLEGRWLLGCCFWFVRELCCTLPRRRILTASCLITTREE